MSIYHTFVGIILGAVFVQQVMGSLPIMDKKVLETSKYVNIL